MVPRDARFEPCLERPAMTCSSWIARAEIDHHAQEYEHQSRDERKLHRRLA